MLEMLSTLIIDRDGNQRTLMPDNTLGPVMQYGRKALIELFAFTNYTVSWFGVPKEYNHELNKAIKEKVVMSKAHAQVYVMNEAKL